MPGGGVQLALHHLSCAPCLRPPACRPETGRWRTPFEYCRAVCRTTARSTQHENAFIAARKHCFSKLGRPRVPVPPAPLLPPLVALVAGAAGQSCEAACQAAKPQAAACAPQHFAALNDCNSLRAKFMCEAGESLHAACAWLRGWADAGRGGVGWWGVGGAQLAACFSPLPPPPPTPQIHMLILRCPGRRPPARPPCLLLLLRFRVRRGRPRRAPPAARLL